MKSAIFILVSKDCFWITTVLQCRDTVITCLVNTGTCLLAGTVTFSILGHMAHNQVHMCYIWTFLLFLKKTFLWCFLDFFLLYLNLYHDVATGCWCEECSKLWSWPCVHHLPWGCSETTWRIDLGDHILLHAGGQYSVILCSVYRACIFKWHLNQRTNILRLQSV